MFVEIEGLVHVAGITLMGQGGVQVPGSIGASVVDVDGIVLGAVNGHGQVEGRAQGGLQGSGHIFNAACVILDGREILCALFPQVLQNLVGIGEGEGVGVQFFCQGGIFGQQLIHGSQVIHHLIAHGFFQGRNILIGSAGICVHQVLVIFLALGEVIQPFIIGSGAFQGSQPLDQLLVCGHEVFVNGSMVPGNEILLFLLCQSLHLLQTLRKCFRHEAVVRVQKIGVAGIEDTVDDRVAQPQPGIGFFLLKGNDAVIVGVNGGQEGKVILHILFTVKYILGQKYGKLRLYAQGGGKGLVVELQSFTVQHGI